MTSTGLWNSTCQFINAMLFMSLSAFAFEQIQDENSLCTHMRILYFTNPVLLLIPVSVGRYTG
jgi:hypothetical protein